MLANVIMKVAAIHQIQNETKLVRRLEGVCHAHYKWTIHLKNESSLEFLLESSMLNLRTNKYRFISNPCQVVNTHVYGKNIWHLLQLIDFIHLFHCL